MHWTPRARIAGWGFLGLFCLLVTASASTTISSLGTERAAGEAFRAESVYVYQNGFCQVLTHVVIDVKDGVAEIDLPEGTILETLRFESSEIHSIVLREGDPTLLPGDRLRLLTPAGIIEGELIEMGMFWALETANGTLYVRPEEIRSFEIVGAAPPAEGTSRVLLHVSGPDGSRTVAVSYVVRGLSWSPSYEIDVEKETLREWVTLRSPTRLIAEKLVLVVGSPSMVFGYDGDMHYRFAGLTATDSTSASGEPSWQPGSFDHFHEYTLDRSFELKPNETVRMRFVEGSIDLDEDLVAHIGRWTGETSANVEWTFKNSFPEPLPPGTVSFYRDGRILGQASMPYLPRNDEARLTSGSERDLVVNVSGRCVRGDWHFTAEASNHDTEAHELIIRFSHGDRESLKKIDPRPSAQEDYETVWRLDMEPDGKEKVSGVLEVPKGEC